MSKLVIKTGMKNEYDIARAHTGPDVTVLTGVQSVLDLEKSVPSDTQAILSFGMCGGLRPELPVVGQTLIASRLLDQDKNVYTPDLEWSSRLFRCTRGYEQTWFSNGLYNTANTPTQRAIFWEHYQAWCVDDESLTVAQFCRTHKLSFAILRNVSDAWDDNVSITQDLLNSHGGVDIWDVIKAFATDPEDMIKIWRHYNLSNTELGITAVQVGPTFQWINK